MKFSFLIVFFIIFFAIFSIISLSQSVGVSPAIINLGEVKEGSTKLVNFFIITPSEETLLVKLEAERVNLDAIENKIINNMSEEDITSWVKVINNPVELKPANNTLKTIGGTIKGWREVSFLMEIPKNAEPGYHLVNIKPIPVESPGTTSPVGGRVVAITSVRVMLDVIGEVIRRGVILDTETGSYSSKKIEINTYFQNTGTTTISASGFQKFYNKSGDLIKSIYLGRKYVKPKQIEIFKEFLPLEEFPLGEYDVYTVFDYISGKAEKSSIITVTIPPTALAVKGEEEIIIPLLLIIILIIIVVSVIFYRRIQ